MLLKNYLKGRKNHTRAQFGDFFQKKKKDVQIQQVGRMYWEKKQWKQTNLKNMQESDIIGIKICTKDRFYFTNGIRTGGGAK